STATTRAPSARNRVAMASPMPCAAPVTTTPRPVNRGTWSPFGARLRCSACSCPGPARRPGAPPDVTVLALAFRRGQLVVGQHALLDRVLDRLAHGDAGQRQVIRPSAPVDREDHHDA